MKKCAVINDISGFGKCSLVATLPILACMQVEAKPFPTAVLSNQTAYDSYFMHDLGNIMSDYSQQWQKLGASFDGIITGFVANEKQFDQVFDFINQYKTNSTLLVVDPIMADDGALYDNYSSAMCQKVKQLCLMANVITPNCTELSILCNKPYTTDIDLLCEYAQSLITPTLTDVIVTGVINGDTITNICVCKDGATLINAPYINGSFSGTGDIFTAIVCGSLLNGKNIVYAVETAQDFIAKSIKSTNVTDSRNGIDFEYYLEDLICKND